MQVSIVGDLPQAVSLVREILSTDAIEAVSGHVSGPLLNELRDHQLALPAVASAESACVGEPDDVVLVAASTADESIRFARMAVQSERSVIVIEPDDVSPAWAFELQLLLDESSTPIVPVCGRMMREGIRTGDVGELPAVERIRQIQIDLQIPAPVADHLARTQRAALDVVSTLGPSYTNVIAVDQTTVDGGLLQRTLTLGSSAQSTTSIPPAAITLRPVSESDQNRLIVQTMDGPEYVETLEPQAVLLPGLLSLLEDRPRVRSWMTNCAASMELDFAASRSLKKRRAIDVHHDTGSERNVFKSQMTAMGCMILLLMMFGLVGYLVIATVFRPSDSVLQVLRGLWIAPAILYLLAQLLLPIARDRASDDGNSN